MSWVVTAVVGTMVATTAYSADQQRKSIHGQMDATNTAQQADATQSAEAETAAQVAANAKIAETKRRRLASTLGTGGGMQTFGGGNVLAAGAAPGTPAPAARAASAAVSAPGGGTALGAGASGAGIYTPHTPPRSISP